MAWSPEFLREGFAVQDCLAPDRIVLGVAGDRAEVRLRQLYRVPLEAGTPLLVMDLETAELIKVAANAFLATKISFINAMAEICEEAGADVIPLAEALGYDARIGRRFLSPGLGYGGGCLPKDVRAFRATAAELGVSSLVSLLGTVDAINLGRRDRVVALARQAAGGSLAGRRVAVLGVAFKPDSDDVRDSPSLAVCDQLIAEGAIVSVHDPVAMPGAAAKRPGPAIRTVGIRGGRGGRSGPALHPVVRLPGHRSRRPGRGRRSAGDHRRALLPRLQPMAQGWLDGACSRAALPPPLPPHWPAAWRGSSGRPRPASGPASGHHRGSAATSPTSPASVRVMPTSTTAAPGLTMSAVSRPGRPAATTTMRVYNSSISLMATG